MLAASRSAAAALVARGARAASSSAGADLPSLTRVRTSRAFPRSSVRSPS